MNADAKKTVLRMIPYGIYVLTADDGKGNIAAATVNWVTQSAFAPPLVSTSDTARIAATLSTTRMTQGAIVINYAPNVTIHSEGAADTAALKRGVLEILERHGRELHQTLTREVVRQQRRDFQPRYSDEQR